MRTTTLSSVSYKFFAALAVIAMALAALPVMPAYAANITVTTTVDELTTNGQCSLREAIANANNNAATHADCTAGAGADVIILTGGQTYTLSLTGASASQTGDLDVTDANGLTIQSTNTTQAVIDANDIDRVIDVALGAGPLTLNYITVTNGTPTAGTTGGGINFGSSSVLTLSNSTLISNTASSTSGCGAGLYNNTAATIHITDSTVADNTCAEAGADGGGVFKGTGGALNLTRSTFSGNSTADNGGGAHFAAGTINITNSTFFNNTAGEKGGGIQVGGATVTVEFSTFSSNVANSSTFNKGGAVQVSSGSAALNRSILANSTGNDCDITAGSGTATATNSLVEVIGDCSGTPTSTADPGLGTLTNNGGPTMTMAIDSTSPAYNAAASCNSITVDQRGVSRPQDGLCDLGAFEASGDPTVVSIVAASANPTSATTVNYTVTFSEPVTGVGASDFSLAVSGVVGANVTSVTPAGPASVYTVTVNTGNGSGTLELQVPASASIQDLDANDLAGLPFTSGDVYTVNKAPSAPGQATLNSPSGTINTANPVYNWDAVFGATWYQLWVNAPSGNGYINQWFTAAQAGCDSGTGTCSVTASKTLAGGAHTWWIRTWNSSGYGPWSGSLNFNVVLPPPPGQATLVSPSGNTTDTRPTYTWNAVSGATWYYLWVNAPTGNGFIKQWYEASAVCGGGTCSIEHPVDLGPGTHTWWIQTWNASGYGPWSLGMSFTTMPPGQATLVSPTGNISDTTPTYTWNAVSGATWYYLWVNAPTGSGFIKQWYEASAVCSGGTCSVTAPTHGSGAHAWWVRTWSSAGYGPWSAEANFTLP